jgi:hypothetical protein
MVGINCLFEIDEILSQVEVRKLTGCLHVFDSVFAGNIFLIEGRIADASSNTLAGRMALDQIFRAKDMTCVWLPDAKPQNVSMDLEVSVYLETVPGGRKDKSKNNTAADNALNAAPSAGTAVVPLNRPVMARHILQAYTLVSESRPNIILDKDGVVLGRDRSCEVQLEHASISRKHCAIRFAPQGLHVMDLNSRNGTYINGERLTEGGIVKEGEQLAIGELQFKVVRGRVISEAPRGAGPLATPLRAS